jgi:hypothetical protein
MDNLSERILNYAKDVNAHGNGVIYYRYKNKDPEQYEAAATFFSSAIGNLYNIVHQNGGVSLINCPDESMKEIGMAYMKIAQIYWVPLNLRVLQGRKLCKRPTKTNQILMALNI